MTLHGEPGGSAKAEKPYAVQYLPNPDLTGFQNDYHLQVGDPVGFHVFKEHGCPRCRHSTSDVFPLVTVAATSEGIGRSVVNHAVRGPMLGARQGFAVAAGYTPVAPVDPAAPDDGTPTYYGLVRCRCPVVHPAGAGRSDSTGGDPIGCGAYWLVTATPHPAAGPGGPTVEMRIDAAPADVDYRALAACRAVAMHTADPVSAVQATAAKWQTALTAVLGLLVVTGFVGGRDTPTGLSGPGQAAIGVTALLSLVCNVWAIYRFTLASAGRSTVVPTGTLSQLEQTDLAPLRQAKRALVAFESALLLTAAAFLSALVTLGLVWFLPDASATASVQVTVSTGNGTTSTTCGRAVIDPQSQLVTVVPKDRTASHTYPLSALHGIGAAC